MGVTWRLLLFLWRWLAGGVQVGTQGCLSTSRLRQLRTPAVNPTFVVLAKAREGVVHAQPHRAIDGAAPGDGTADVRGWRREDP